MATLTRRKPRLSWHQVLQAVQELSPQEQCRLRAELEKSTGVHLVRPTGNAAAIRRGRRLAKAVQAELAVAASNSLDDTMIRLRGQSWSSILQSFAGPPRRLAVLAHRSAPIDRHLAARAG